MSRDMRVFEARPYMSNEIPKVDIDYRGLIAYAHSVGKKVPELSDVEKERFIVSLSMEEIRKIMLK